MTQRKIALDVLMACWGMGTWLGVNGLYVQLPLLVERLPEGWALPSSMVLAIQLANVGLLIYAGLKRLLKTSEAPYIYGLLIIGTLALILNAFLYSKTVVLNGKETSVAFLALTFCAALVGCTSSVLFYPYLRYYRNIYLVTYLVGEGLSGFVPSIISLIQGVDGEPECVPSEDNTEIWPVYPPPLFSATVYLLILALLSTLSLISFTALDNLSVFHLERIQQKTENAESTRESEFESEKDVTINTSSDIVSSLTEIRHEDTRKPVILCSVQWVSVMLLMAFLNALMNGVLPSVQTYSCLPYGTTAYHLAVTLSAIANPAVCLAGVWLQPMPVRALAVLLTVTLLPLSYILATALLSPAPPLQDHIGGVILVVAAWICASAVISYARLWVFEWARRGGGRGMRACGVSTQVGSALGSLAIFLLVNYLQLFTEAERCPAPLSISLFI